MELTYRLTRDDHVQCCKLVRQRVAPLVTDLQGWKRAAAFFTAWLAVVLLTLAVLASGVIDEHTAVVACIAYVGGACSVCLYSLFLQRRYLANLLTDDSSFLSESRFDPLQVEEAQRAAIDPYGRKKLQLMKQSPSPPVYPLYPWGEQRPA